MTEKNQYAASENFSLNTFGIGKQIPERFFWLDDSFLRLFFYFITFSDSNIQMFVASGSLLNVCSDLFFHSGSTYICQRVFSIRGRQSWWCFCLSRFRLGKVLTWKSSFTHVKLRWRKPLSFSRFSPFHNFRESFEFLMLGFSTKAKKRRDFEFLSW